jgi:hypothetical protein
MYNKYICSDRTGGGTEERDLIRLLNFVGWVGV